MDTNWLQYNLIQDKITSVEKCDSCIFVQVNCLLMAIFCAPNKKITRSPDTVRSVKIWQLIVITVISFQFKLSSTSTIFHEIFTLKYRWIAV